MVISGITRTIIAQTLLKRTYVDKAGPRAGRTYKTKNGAILPEPQVTSFGIIRIILTVVPGLLIGAAISKNIANFLEENDLFVPSDDDDDDD